MPVQHSFLNVKALVGAFNQEKALGGAFSVIVQPVVEPMDRFAALHKTDDIHNVIIVMATSRCLLLLLVPSRWSFQDITQLLIIFHVSVCQKPILSEGRLSLSWRQQAASITPGLVNMLAVSIHTTTQHIISSSLMFDVDVAFFVKLLQRSFYP